MTGQKSALRKIPRTIWAIGFVSLLSDVSSEMVHGLLPIFLVSTLGASLTLVGFIEGLGEATTLFVKVFSGPISDWMKRRKPLVLLGYSLGAVSKPVFALAQSSDLVLFARVFDRLGKGIRAAPRDALVSDLAPPDIRGAAFGLRQSLDTMGAFLGPLAAILLMQLLGSNFRLVFWIAAIPGLLSVLVVVFGVNEAENAASETKQKVSFAAMRGFDAAFWTVAFAGGVFQLARFSEAFLVLRAKDIGLQLGLTPAVLIAMNVVYSLAAYPIGLLSDHVKRQNLILLGFLVLIASDLCLAFAGSVPAVFIGVLLWGLHMALTQGTLAALVADHSPLGLRGTAFGLFNLVSAVALLIASPLAGILWDLHGPRFTFLASAIFALAGGVILLTKKI